MAGTPGGMRKVLHAHLRRFGTLMTVVTGTVLAQAGIDAVALKPSEVDPARASDLGVETITIDYEGREHLPAPERLRELTRAFDVRVTVPVRADGFDPFGNESLRESLPDSVREVLVAGHPAYLSDGERKRAVAPRLEAAHSSAADPWVGTEGIERLALAVGGTQFDLLSNTTTQEIRALRAAGYEDPLAVYAPTVMAEDEDAILDAVGDYAARRQRVADRLPAEVPHDSSASGEPREILLEACQEYALVGDIATITDRVEALRSAGVDHVVSYPARGLEPLRG